MSVPSIATVQKACDYVARKYAESQPGGVFLQEIYDNAKVVDISKDLDENVVVSFKLHTIKRFKNSMQMVHGGASASLISIFSVLALAGDGKYWKNAEPTEDELNAFMDNFGVTRTLETQIIQAVPLKADIFVKVRIVSNTKSNAYLSAGIYNSNGKILVSGTHDMMKSSPAPKDPNDPLYLKAHFNTSSKL